MPLSCSCSHCQAGARRSKRHWWTRDPSPRRRKSCPYQVISPRLAERRSQFNECNLISVNETALLKPHDKTKIYNVTRANCASGKDEGFVTILKWKRKSHCCRKTNLQHLQSSVHSAEKAAELVYYFSKRLDTHGWSVLVNCPRIVQVDNRCGNSRTTYAIAERYLPHTEMFNCARERSKQTNYTYIKVLQALSHFSYIWTTGNMLLCNLRGFVDKKAKLVVLTEPAILSKDGYVFGCTDIGPRKMKKFMRYHHCNSICCHLPSLEKKSVFFRPVRRNRRSWTPQE